MIDGYAAVGIQCRQRLVNIYQKMRDAESLLEIVPVKDKNVSEALKLYNELFSKTGDTFHEIEMSKRFFTSMNLSILVKAVEKDPNISQGLELRSQQLSVLESKRKKGDFIRIPIPYDFQVVTFSRNLAA